MNAKEVIAHLQGVKKSENGWLARCPSHADKHASLSISEGSDGKLLLQCHANKGCTFESILAAIPHSNGNGNGSRIVAEYDYRDRDDKVIFQSVRKEPKDFFQRRPDGQGGWINNLKGVERVLYRLPELLTADPHGIVVIPEGEKDVDNLIKIDIVATCNPCGAGKWRDQYNEALRGRRVIVIPDNDTSGYLHAQQVATSLSGIAASVKVVQLPGLAARGDISDWLAAGNGLKELGDLIKEAPEFQIATTSSALPVFTAGELMAREFSPLRWAIMGLLAEGLFILAGRPKLGKSWLVLNFAVAIACGGYALGTIKVEAGDVLYCALEDGARRLQERLKRALRGGSVPDRLYLATEWKPLDQGGLEDLENWIKAHPTVRLIVFDTLERIRPREDPKARLYHSDYQAVKGLQDLTKQYGVCVLVVHHTRKQHADDHLDLVSGSTGLTGAADGIQILKRGRGEVDATLTANGRDFPDTELALKFDPELCDWRALGDAADYRLSNERRDVIELLRKSQPLAPKEISELLSRDRTNIKALLWKMAKDGVARADTKGQYSLIEAPAVNASNSNVYQSLTEKGSFLKGNNGRGHPVNAVNGFSQKVEFEGVFEDPKRQQVWDEWQSGDAS